MKLTLRYLAVALFLTTICKPATLFAASKSDSSAPPVVHKPVLPPDGNPWPRVLKGDGPAALLAANKNEGSMPPVVHKPTLPPDGNPWPR